MADRSADWLAQADRDLEQARASQRDGRHEWACFAAQQSAEKALVDKARYLDNLYVPTRYANGHPDGPPFEHYGTLQSNLAIEYAREILAFVRAHLAGS
jgi:HEPN domain-containing protein